MTIRSTTAHLAILAGCMALAAPAHAEEESDEVGNIIHMECTSPDTQVETGCLLHLSGFLAGWHTAVREIAAKANVPPERLAGHCIPDRASLGDIRDALVKGLEAMPDNGRKEDGNLATMTILAKAFPCSNPATPAN